MGTCTNTSEETFAVLSLLTQLTLSVYVPAELNW